MKKTIIKKIIFQAIIFTNNAFCNTLVYTFSFDTKVISKLHFLVSLTQKSTLDRSVFSTIGSGNTDNKNVIYFIDMSYLKLHFYMHFSRMKCNLLGQKYFCMETMQSTNIKMI